MLRKTDITGLNVAIAYRLGCDRSPTHDPVGFGLFDNLSVAHRPKILRVITPLLPIVSATNQQQAALQSLSRQF